MMPRPLRAFSAVLLLVTIAQSIESAVGDSPTTTRSNPSTTTKSGPVHGLNLSVYPRQRERAGSWDYELFELDEFSVPRIAHPERRYFQRIDPQIAYGGKDGVAFEGDHLSACAWTGYIRLPVAGTYHLATASERGSAVYVNGARVALNGNYGGTIPSEHFEYPEGHGARAPYDAANQQYSLPISVSGPRVFPIEVRFYRFPEAGKPPQITLYWVTPDSPKGPGGKPLLHIVPTDSLFAELPQQHRDEIEAPPVSAAHCTISCDRLYLAPGAPDATVRVRLADRAGRGVPGKRVFIWQSGSRMPGVLEQPSRTTDDNGETVAVLKPAYDVGELRLYAFDMTDLVQVPQVCYTYNPSGPLPQFFPWGTTPYFDDKFEVSPKPMVAGKPITITVPLTNRTQQAESVYVVVESNAPNIGAFVWNPCGKSAPQALAPGESGAAKTTFTMKEHPGKVCFRLTLWRKGSANKQAAGREAVMLASADERTAVRLAMQDVAHGDQPMETRQQNIGPVVGGAPIDGESGNNGRSGSGPRGGSGPNPPLEGELPPPTDCEFRTFDESRNPAYDWGAGFGGDDQPGQTTFPVPPLPTYAPPGLAPLTDEVIQATTDLDRVPPYYVDQLRDLERLMKLYWEQSHNPQLSAMSQEWNRCMSMSYARVLDAMRRVVANDCNLWHLGDRRPTVRGDAQDVVPLAATGAPLEARSIRAGPAPLVRFVADTRPVPHGTRQRGDGPGFRRLAAAPFHSPTGFLHAMLESELRQRAAAAALDHEWSAKHATAVRLYRQRAVDALHRHAAMAHKQGANRAGELHEQLAKSLGQLTPSDPSQAYGGRPGPMRSSTFAVFNPRDNEATVQLLVRRLSVPPGARLSVVDAEPQHVDGKLVSRVRPTGDEKFVVTLPPQGQIKVRSEIVPVEQAGQNTTARWSVEGHIDSELLGGIMHEMHVPALLPDLALPPVGWGPPVAQLPALATDAVPSRANWWMYGIIIAGVSFAFVVFVILLARKRYSRASA